MGGAVAMAALAVSTSAGTASASTRSPHPDRWIQCERDRHRVACRVTRGSLVGASVAAAAPTVTITAGPTAGSTTTATTATFAFAASGSGVSFHCAIDGQRLHGCSSPKTYGGLGAGAHSFRVFAHLSATGVSGPSSTLALRVVGAAAPAPAPTGLSATPGNRQVALSWSPSSGSAGYRVLRGGAQIARTSSTAYPDSGLTNGTAYSYTVAAYDAAGALSSPSPAIS